MREKKHAYVEKPLTHNINEARLMTTVAKENGIVTQMGNQGASSDGSREAKEWIQSGVIGKYIKWIVGPTAPFGRKGFPYLKVKTPSPKGWIGIYG